MTPNQAGWFVDHSTQGVGTTERARLMTNRSK